MKKIILFFLLAYSANSYCQELKTTEKVYKLTEVDEKPEFEGGINELHIFVQKNFTPPEELGLNGKVIIEFIVEKDGFLTNMKIAQDIGYGSGQAVLKVFQKSPKWIPGKKDNQIVRTLFVFPIIINNME